MSGRIPTSDDFWPLLNSACDGTLAETQAEELAALLDSDPAARKVFLDHVQLRRNIRLLGRTERVRDLGLAQVHETLPSSSPSPALGILSTNFPGAVGFFSSDWSVSYLIATVVCAIAAVVGSLIYVSRNEQVVDNSPPPVRDIQLPPQPKVEYVGRITGMVDCVLEEGSGVRGQGPESDTHHSSFIIHQSRVALGDQFSLRSGLLEITYNTGAKVILQGPVTYEVESSAGGYLSVGKLTARLEKRGERER